MKTKITNIGKVCLVTGLVLLNLVILMFSSTAYAIVDKNTSPFIMEIDKSTKQVNEEAIFTIESLNSEEETIEFSLPDGADFNEEVTKKLNTGNVMVDTISVVEIQGFELKKESNNALGKVL